MKYILCGESQFHQLRVRNPKHINHHQNVTEHRLLSRTCSGIFLWLFNNISLNIFWSLNDHCDEYSLIRIIRIVLSEYYYSYSYLFNLSRWIIFEYSNIWLWIFMNNLPVRSTIFFLGVENPDNFDNLDVAFIE